MCEAAQRPTRRFVAAKGEEVQAAAMVLLTRDLLVRQRAQAIDVLRIMQPHWRPYTCQHPTWRRAEPSDSSCSDRGVHTCP